MNAGLDMFDTISVELEFSFFIAIISQIGGSRKTDGTGCFEKLHFNRFAVIEKNLESHSITKMALLDKL